jgi:transcription elongation factor GreA
MKKEPAMEATAVWMPSATLSALQAEISDLEAGAGAMSLADIARLAEMRALVRNADISAKPDDGLVEPGMLVTVRFGADEDTETFLLGDRGVLSDARALSPTSPLGSAVNGTRVGDLVTYAAPNGPIAVAVVAAEPALAG